VGALATSPSAFRIAALLACAVVLLLAAFAGVLAVVIRPEACAGGEASPSTAASHDIPSRYLTAYRETGNGYAVPWQVSRRDRGDRDRPRPLERTRRALRRQRVRLLRWTHAVQPHRRPAVDLAALRHRRKRRRREGRLRPRRRDPLRGQLPTYAAAKRHGNLRQAIFGYNHSLAYVNDVLARARSYASEATGLLTTSGDAVGDACASEGLDAPTGPADVRTARRVASPRAIRNLPAWAMAGGRAPQAVDARLYDNVIWILRRYHLNVTAAREPGHHTHGDGTAVDLVPADGITQPAWDASAGRLAHDLGWTRECGSSGTRPTCALMQAIQFVGYDGYPGHGSPRTCSGACRAHLHVSWVSPCFGSSGLAPPCERVAAFPAGAAAAAR
jgi:hypothetical protein